MPARLRMALMRCSVRSMPARLSSPKSPTRSVTYSRSWWVTCTGVEDGLAVGEPRLGLAAEVEDDLEEVAALLGQPLRGGGHARRKCLDEEAQLLLP